MYPKKKMIPLKIENLENEYDEEGFPKYIGNMEKLLFIFIRSCKNCPFHKEEWVYEDRDYYNYCRYDAKTKDFLKNGAMKSMGFENCELPDYPVIGKKMEE